MTTVWQEHAPVSAEATWWQTLVAAETTFTVGCAGLSAAFFLRAWRHEGTPGRRTAALALALTAVGAAGQAAASLAWRTDPALAATVGLPACAGQALVALLVLRQRHRE
jgi:hypothetical protein